MEKPDMNTKNTAINLEDSKVNVKIRLALLWAALMFFYFYNDIFSLWQPGHLAQLLEGHLEGVEMTQTILFAGAILMCIPSLMVLLSVTLKARANRLVNIIMGFLQMLILLATQFVGGGETWFYWRFFELMEAVFLGLIIWSAWKWPVAEPR